MTPPTFFCKNTHNFEEVKSPDPKLCLHCFNLKINDDLDAEIDCNCGCNGVCPECDGERFVEYVFNGDDSRVEGCQVCNEEGYNDNDDDDEAWRDM
jgi:hypothetical protein